MNKSKLIFSPQLAQWLLQNGYIIIDLKPKKDNPKETVFVFNIDTGFQACVQAWLEKDNE